MVCIVTAAEYPSGVRATVLLDPPLFSYTDGVHILPQTEQWFRLAASINRGDPSPDERLERLRAAMPDAPTEQINQMAGYLADVVSGAPEVALRDGAWEGLPLPDALQRIECPTLLIHGDWDSGAVIRASDIDYVKSYLPSVATVHLNGADHGLKIDQQPELVLDPVLAFLNTI
jgi:pimeloyl-ACP methyl ester carboxylesterase